MIKNTSEYWIERLHEHNLWAMEVLDWEHMSEQEAYKVLKMEQVVRVNGKQIVTTRCPIKINGERLYSDRPAPELGEHNRSAMEEFGLET